MNITKIQRTWRRLVQIPCLTFMYAMRQERGNLYVLRNAPNWFVRWLSTIHPDETEVANLRKFLIAVQKEQGLRRLLRRRELAKAKESSYIEL